MGDSPDDVGPLAATVAGDFPADPIVALEAERAGSAVLHRLSVVHSPTMAYAPYQNGKCEAWWAAVEGRLMAMLDGVEPLTARWRRALASPFIPARYIAPSGIEAVSKRER